MTNARSEVAVVGSINLDIIAQTLRIPSPGETVLSTNLSYRTGGKGANQAVAAYRAGAEVTFIGAVGDDDFGRQMLEELRSTGLTHDRISTSAGTPSGVAIIVVDRRAANTVTVAPGANQSINAHDVAHHLDECLPSAAVLVLQGEISLETAAYAARRASRTGTRVIFNASPLGLAENSPASLRSLLSETDVLVVNESEARELAGRDGTAQEIAAVLREFGPEEVVMTLGSHGAVVADAEGVVLVPAFTVDDIDTTGAGDAFCGVLAAELASGSLTISAIRVASAAGALATTKLGAQEAAPQRETIEQFLRERGDIEPAE